MTAQTSLPKNPEIPCAPDRSRKTNFRDQLPEIVDIMVDSCYDKVCFEHVDADPLPSRQQVITIIETCREILFPGYFRTKGLDRINLKYRLGLEITDLYDRLAAEITESIRHECIRYGKPCQECESEGQKKALAFTRELPRLRTILATDIQAAYDGDPAASGTDEIIFSYPGPLAIMIYRIAHQLYKQEIPLLPRIMSEHAHSITGIDIHPGAQIGASFFIDHGTGVVIGQTSVIGNRVKLYQGVTLGALSFKRDESGNLDRSSKRHPTLEDEVTVYAGTTILGGDTIIGARSVVGGNVWLTQSVPPDTKVLLNPPELIMKTKT
ncbi:MAG: serine acetyltransferase [Proteobacteria bacterium]|nr:serine acetyltransferase [Pseudomonadota bacterium]MBU1715854.1 serine acetyltransferase [Pseudomonadota bacterium]